MNMHSKIKSIVGEPVSAVSFVQDYVEFHFDGRVIRSLTNPILTVDDNNYCFPKAGSRDELCKLIGKELKDVIVEDDVRIDLVFFGGSKVTISLANSDRIGPEAAHFVPGDNQPIEVW